MWPALIGNLFNLVKWAGAFFLARKYGIDAVKKEQLEAENEILKKQRDNDVHNVADALRLHKSHRKK